MTNTMTGLHTPSVTRGSHGEAWRRFAARYFDFMGATYVAGCALYHFPTLNDWLSGTMFGHTSVGLVAALCAAPILALLVSTVGLSPGKWVFALKVTDYHGRRLSFRAALRREVGAIVSGLGCNFLPFITGPIAYHALLKHGEVAWDRNAGAQINCHPMSLKRIIAGGLAAAVGIWVVAYFFAMLL